MRAPLVLIPQHFGCLVFDRRNSRYAPFDHETTSALRHAHAVGAAAVVGEESDSARRALLSDFFEYFLRAGYFTPDGFLAAEILDAEPPADHLLGPLAVHLEVVAACNLRCTHCFAGDLPRKSDLTLPELDRLFRELSGLGSFRLGLTGGEPLLRKDLFDVLDAATAYGLHPCLTTNGLLLDERVARELGRRELVWLNVSLEGATAATNDAVRGVGTFDLVTERLRAVRRYMRFTLAFTVTHSNAVEVEACAELARELGAHTAVFRPLYPVGVAREHPELMPTFDEYSEAMRKLGGVGGACASAIDPSMVDSSLPASPSMPHESGQSRAREAFGAHTRAATQARTFSAPGCGAANLVASVSASGDVNPCSFLGSAFEAGNLRSRSFAAIWHDSNVFRALRETRGDFRGGCRVRALAAKGSAYAADPWEQEWRERKDGRPPPLANLHTQRQKKHLALWSGS